LGFPSGARTNASTFATNLTGQESPIYLSTMPTCLACPPFYPVEQPPKLRIVIYGELLRGIGRDGSCHGDLNNNGKSFARGAAGGTHEGPASGLRIRQRNNDISQPMRNIVLDHAERFEEAAGYDASPPPNVLKAVG
jgi:hypothetical protein